MLCNCLDSQADRDPERGLGAGRRGEQGPVPAAGDSRALRVPRGCQRTPGARVPQSGRLAGSGGRHQQRGEFWRKEKLKKREIKEKEGKREK